MTNISTPISSIAGLTSGTNPASKSTSSSTADIISSFKEILSVMTATSGMTSSSQAGGMGMNMGDLMAPLMLLMMERLIEQTLGEDLNTSSAGMSQSTAATSSTSSVGTTGSTDVPSGRPVEGRITQEPHTGHTAFDIGIPVGTPIKTTMDGTVIHAGWNDQGYGNLVIVENGPYRTYYAHLSSIPVSVGDQVSAGSIIGLSGNTGNSTGPHLHYEIRKNKVAIDPTSYMLG